MAHAHSIKEYPGQIAAVAGIAAAVGAATALLTAPKKGSEMRQAIKEKGQHLKTRNSRIMQAEKQTASKAASRAKTATKQVTKDTKTAIKRTKADAKDVADEIRRNGEP